MDSLTESEMRTIARLQREAGVQRLSCHFPWSEFCDERQCFHQEFVYDAAMFAVARGFPWSNVIGAAVVARNIFPHLEGLETPKLLSLVKDALSECIPKLTLVHQYEFTRYITDICTSRRQLFQAVVDGATDLSITQQHLEVHLPPTPCPLTQGTELHEWEHQQQLAKLILALQQKEEELERLRNGTRVTVECTDIPGDEQLDKEALVKAVRAAVKATEGQILESLDQEATLLNEILELKLQHTVLATRRLHNPLSSSSGHVSTNSAKTKVHTGKTKK
ncbi:uncharacterized protein C8orf74 homolog [Sphaeramia orbicularis]|uniref:uncharacterized protein C8orf74 homolog n=1 Tax=Sphaeramia orbicularis TaxID=375764 RepID=UPI00117EE3D3|nr:uncharacterized protein C8orf74 homolog [Sphaeramia orbicularis]